MHHFAIAFDAWHTPVAMQVQQSPTNTMRFYISRLFIDVANQNVRSVLCARTQALVDQVCRACPSAAGRRATFSELSLNQEAFKICINQAFRKVLACERTSA